MQHITDGSETANIPAQPTAMPSMASKLPASNDASRGKDSFCWPCKSHTDKMDETERKHDTLWLPLAFVFLNFTLRAVMGALETLGTPMCYYLYSRDNSSGNISPPLKAAQ